MPLSGWKTLDPLNMPWQVRCYLNLFLQIDGLGIGPYFATILISEAEEVAKPEPEIFHRALRNLGVGPQETIMVGDNPVADIEGAKSLGIKAIWKQDN